MGSAPTGIMQSGHVINGELPAKMAEMNTVCDTYTVKQYCVEVEGKYINIVCYPRWTQPKIQLDIYIPTYFQNE